MHAAMTKFPEGRQRGSIQRKITNDRLIIRSNKHQARRHTITRRVAAPSRAGASSWRRRKEQPRPTLGGPGYVSLRSGSTPLAPDMDRCRLVAWFPTSAD